ncbi:hypothetical protein CTKA_00981 [Chthonomonas calidirosea]|uniref:Uncharacterized protein n=2 Tax=Chthonomonas TaxID=1077265 RepID=S0ESS2_CHTCT|nr:hypothetical protein CCALI_00177 [Chthonomonas calidirosea T49]CEK16004.1 hypothetical protein CTKA_00981 [Chthonomonas calidirosea]
MLERYYRKLWLDMLQKALTQAGLSSADIALDAQTLTVQAVPQPNQDVVVQLLHLTKALYDNWRRKRGVRCFIKYMLTVVALQGVGLLGAAYFGVTGLNRYADGLVAAVVCALPFTLFMGWRIVHDELEAKAFRLSVHAIVQALNEAIHHQSRLTETQWELLLNQLCVLHRRSCYLLSCTLVPYLLALKPQNQQDEGVVRLLCVSLPSLLNRRGQFSNVEEGLGYSPDFVLAVLRLVREGCGMSQDLSRVLRRLKREFAGEEIGEVAGQILAEWSKARSQLEEAKSLGRAAHSPRCEEERAVLLRGDVKDVKGQTSAELLRPSACDGSEVE